MSTSLSPNGILARLDELKKWQQMQQQRFSKQSLKEGPSPNDLDLISPIPKRNSAKLYDDDGVTPFSDSDDGRNQQRINMQQQQSTFKGLTDDTPKMPKRPFLRKGTGLAKFRMTLDDTKPLLKPPSCILKSKAMKQSLAMKKEALMGKKNVSVKQNCSKSPPLSPVPPESRNKRLQSPKRKPVATNVHPEMTRAPTNAGIVSKPPNEKQSRDEENVPQLENPQISFAYKPKGLWTNVSDVRRPDLSTVEEEESIISQINRIVCQNGPQDTPNCETRQDLTAKINQLLGQMPFDFNVSDLEDQFLADNEKCIKNQYDAVLPPRNNDNFRTPVNIFQKPPAPIIERRTEAPPAEVNQSARDLQVFEALEQKAAHSSFCSTNSSVAYLLSMQSTPKKVRVASPEVSPNTTINSEDVKDDTDVNYGDTNHWSTTEAESETESEGSPTVRDRIRIVIDAETMTDPALTDGGLTRRIPSYEEEIQVFRSENSRLAKAKIDSDRELRDLRKRMKEMEEDKRCMENKMEEEKRRLSKDKMVFEKYVKDLKNKPSKKEREEITMLRNDLAAAKEELKLKESRHGAAQARLRTQVKLLEKDKDALVAELEGLRTQNGRLMAQQKLGRPFTDTKIIHEINKKLTKLAQNKLVPEKKTDTSRTSCGSNKSNSIASGRNVENAAFSNARSRNTTEEEDEDDEGDTEEEEETDYNTIRTNCNNNKPDKQTINGKSIDSFPVVYARQISHPIIHGASKEKILDVEKFPSKYDLIVNDVEDLEIERENNGNLLNRGESNSTFKTSDTIERDYAKMFAKQLSDQEIPPVNYTTMEESHRKERKERSLKDGSQEITYPNGNVKTLSPDGQTIKMVYYNGDVKKTDLNSGIIDYVYAESGIQHLTYSDGTEVLNFPDGKIEKRYKDGKFEIISPDGVTRIVDPSGEEDVTYPDGTRVSISNEGEKVVKLPNGQRIVHTKEHKRREYPDGTVNILYPDGLLETRYTNGRIRLKDANGRCLMDSHENGT